MCLEVRGFADQELARKFRRKGHVLVKGDKALNQGAISMMNFHKWKRGWNTACFWGRPLIAKQIGIEKHIPRKAYYSGFHVCLNKRKTKNWWVCDEDDYIQPVWFYADEVKAAEYGEGSKPNTILVNRVRVR